MVNTINITKTHAIVGLSLLLAMLVGFFCSIQTWL
jgi:hypothetical protein